MAFPAAVLGTAGTLALGISLFGVPGARSDAPSTPTSPAEGRLPVPRFPPEPGSLAPSALRTTGAGMSPAALGDVARCAPCHADAVAQWRSSAHAQSSFGNPFYRASVEDFGARRGPRESQFCAGCHDPVLALAGGMDRGPAAVSPEDPLAQVGVACLICHGGRDPGPEGNGSLAVDLSPVPIPVPGEPESLAAHVARLRPPGLGGSALCGSCHRAHLGPSMGAAGHLPGMDDLGAWSRSPWSGSVGEDPELAPLPRRRCPSCHMPGEAAPQGDLAAFRGRIRSHRFPGAQTDLAADDPAQREAVADILGRAVTVHVAGARVGDQGSFRFPGAVRPEPGEDLVVDVVVDNVGAGHRFPGGTRDLQGAFVTLEVADARGRRLAGGSQDPAGVHPLRATIVDGKGVPERLHRVDRFVAPVADTTVPARTARAYRFRWATPPAGAGDELAWPLRLTARVIHRRHDPTFRSFVCEAEGTPRGRRFRAAAGRRGVGAGASGCGPPASIVVASDRATVGAPGPGADRLALALVHGRALARGLGDRDLTDARARVLASLRRTPPGAPAATIARAQLTLARIAGRLGRTGEALAWLDRAAARVGPHPAIDRIRGDALVRVWRFPQAAAAYRRAARATPRDPTLWRALARAAGSAGEDRFALIAAGRGLAGLPHDPSLLRTQALALRALDAPGARRATEAWLTHRLPDEGEQLAWRCGDRDGGCERERAPIPEVRVSADR